MGRSSCIFLVALFFLLLGHVAKLEYPSSYETCQTDLQGCNKSYAQGRWQGRVEGWRRFHQHNTHSPGQARRQWMLLNERKLCGLFLPLYNLFVFTLHSHPQLTLILTPHVVLVFDICEIKKHLKKTGFHKGAWQRSVKLCRN